LIPKVCLVTLDCVGGCDTNRIGCPVSPKEVITVAVPFSFAENFANVNEPLIWLLQSRHYQTANLPGRKDELPILPMLVLDGWT